MIDLEKYILLENEFREYDLIDFCMFKHIEIEQSYFPLFESHGLFNSAAQFSKQIIEAILSAQIHKENTCEVEFTNTFVKKIVFDISYNDVGVLQCGYVANKSKYNKSENIFDIIVVEINSPQENVSKYKETFIKQLYHELTHAYEDYCLRISSVSKKLVDFYSNSYNNAKYYKGESGVKKLVSDFIYYSAEPERNAYISELYDVLLDKYFASSDKSAIDKCFDIIKNEKFYKTFKFVGELLKELKGNNTKINNSIFLQCCQILQNKRGEKLSETFDRIHNEWEKWNKQISKVVPKIICDFVSNERILESISNTDCTSLPDYI